MEADRDTFLQYLYTQKKYEYQEFEILKKSGGIRKITAPLDSSRLKSYQKKLNSLLQEYIKDNNIPLLDHAFIKNKSIMTNAELHVSKRLVFNIDLKDFFNHINFGRVRGFFIKNEHFKFPENISTVLAELVTYNNKLPQGAPSSPIISNLVGSTLDYYLLELARINKCHYSRYADDITFSTNKSEFPREIAIRDQINTHLWKPSEVLIKKVEKAGFTINLSKTNMCYQRSRQVVTGLVVNKEINVLRSFYKKTRVMVDHLLKKNYYFCEDDSEENRCQWNQLSILEGRLNHIFTVKSWSKPTSINIPFSDYGYVQLYRRFLFYKYIVANQYPFIITEGHTDVLHIENAIKKVGLTSPDYFGEGDRKVRYLKHGSKQMQILKLTDRKGTTGASLIRVFLDNCFDFYSKFKKPMLNKPVIIILDNDDGILSFNKDSKGKKRPYLDLLTNRSYINVYNNLYLLPLKTYKSIEDSKKSFFAIEKLYPIDIRSLFLTKDGVGKSDFAKKIIHTLPKESLKGFEELLLNISEISNNFFYEQSKILFTCEHENGIAKGFLVPGADRFVVLTNSKVSSEEGLEDGCSYYKLRRRLMGEGVILEGKKAIDIREINTMVIDILFFKNNYIFNSPSAAASVILGKSVNGWLHWKKDGKSLKSWYK